MTIGRSALLLAVAGFAIAAGCGSDRPADDQADTATPEAASSAPSPAEPAAEASAPAQPDGVRSDRFELDWELDGSDLLLAIDTDLPDNAELSVSVRRTYYEKGNSAAYSRDYFSEFEPVSRWRSPRRISLDSETWKADLKAFQDEMAPLGEGMAFEVDRIEPDIKIRAVLHLNQDAPAFGGRGNPNLSGDAVTSEPSGNIVEAEVEIPYPLDGPPPTGASSIVNHAELEVGSAYELSAEIPLMPEFEPADPMAALEQVVQLPAGSQVRVITVRSKRGTPWYEVETGSGDTGWVNSTALIGQTIRRVSG